MTRWHYGETTSLMPNTVVETMVSFPVALDWLDTLRLSPYCTPVALFHASRWVVLALASLARESGLSVESYMASFVLPAWLTMHASGDSCTVEVVMHTGQVVRIQADVSNWDAQVVSREPTTLSLQTWLGCASYELVEFGE